MGVFSEIAMEQQNSMFDSSAAFEDDEAFELALQLSKTMDSQIQPVFRQWQHRCLRQV